MTATFRKNTIYALALILLCGFLSSAFCNRGFCQASGEDESRIKEIIQGAIEGMAGANLSECSKNFLKEKFKFLIDVGPDKDKPQDWATFVNSFESANTGRLIMDVNSVQFLDIKIVGSRAAALVSYSKTNIYYKTKETKSKIRKDAFSLEKTADGWKITEWKNSRKAPQKPAAK